MGKVDATEETELAQEHAVRGYPTLKFFKNGRMSDFNGKNMSNHTEERNFPEYTNEIHSFLPRMHTISSPSFFLLVGGRTAKEIVTWLTKRSGPPAQTLSTTKEAKEFSQKEDVVIIGFFTDESSDKAKVYINSADSQDSLFFGIVTCSEIAEAMDATMDSIVVYKKFDEGHSVFDGEWNAESIVTFILGEQLPLVTKFSDEVKYFIVCACLTLSSLSSSDCS